MGAIDNLNSSEFPDIFRRLRALETATPLSNASIGAGGIRVHSGGVITIENGGLRVTGTAEIIGALIASGTIDFTGDVTISGPLTIEGATDITGDTTVTGDFTTNGPLHVNGATDISGNLDVDGTLDINGVATLNNDLNVQGGGIINVGPNMTLNPAVAGGSIQYFSGGGVENAAGVTVVKGAGDAGLITSDTADLFAGSTQISVGNGYVDIEGLPTTTGVTANLYMDPSTKRVYRIT